MGMRGAALVFGLLCTVGSTVVEAQYNSALAMSALYYCKASYCDAGTIGSWNCPPCSYHPSFTSVNVYHNMSIDSQGFTGYDTNSNTIVVAFRGSANIENWFSDLDFTFTTYPVAACNCQVHQGFFDEWLSLSSSVLADVRNLVSQYSGAQILVTGHSLGAAVSILAALDIVNEVTSSGVTVYNFGQPRVGDNSFAAYAAGMLPQGRQFRVTHGYDPVPHVPRCSLAFCTRPTNCGTTTTAPRVGARARTPRRPRIPIAATLSYRWTSPITCSTWASRRNARRRGSRRVR